MTKEKRLGIWMDHSNAHLMEFSMSDIETTTISSNFTHQVKEDTLNKSENLMHHKERHTQAEYYKHLGESIRNYEQVLLFGPTEAKTELLHILRADHRFDKIKIEIKSSDKMIEIKSMLLYVTFFMNIYKPLA